MVVSGDAKLRRVLTRFETRPQNGVVHYVEEGANAVPALVVKPNLKEGWGGVFKLGFKPLP